MTPVHMQDLNLQQLSCEQFTIRIGAATRVCSRTAAAESSPHRTCTNQWLGSIVPLSLCLCLCPCYDAQPLTMCTCLVSRLSSHTCRESSASRIKTIHASCSLFRSLCYPLAFIGTSVLGWMSEGVLLPESPVVLCLLGFASVRRLLPVCVHTLEIHKEPRKRNSSSTLSLYLLLLLLIPLYTHRRSGTAAEPVLFLPSSPSPPR